MDSVSDASASTPADQADAPVPLHELPAVIRDLTADRRRLLDEAPTPRAAERLHRLWAVGSRQELRRTRAQARELVQAWKDDRDAAAGAFVLQLADAQNTAHTRSGPARRRIERQARRRGRQAPVRRGPDHLAPTNTAEERELLLSPLEQVELSAVRTWIRDWDAERPADDRSLSVDDVADVARALRSAESVQESLNRVRASWTLQEASTDAQEAADAPATTPPTGASERPANNLGSDLGAVAEGHRKPAGQIADRRTERYSLREALQPHRTTDRLKGCGAKPTGGRVAMTAGPSGLAALKGLQTCASVWNCPVCGPKIRAARARELEEFAAAWIARGGRPRHPSSDLGQGRGGGLVMATFTFQHHKRLALADLMTKLAAAWTRMLTYRRYRRIKAEMELAGYTRAEEITHGRNGWHPHLHVLFWFPDHITQEKADDLREDFYDMWRQACAAEGLGTPSQAHGVDFRAVARGKEGAKALARYIAKVEGPDGTEYAMGNEMMRGDLKEGRRAESKTPFEIAREWEKTGERKWLKLWLEYETATHNHKAITWSNGLKKHLQELLDIVEDSRTDHEIASGEEPGAVEVAYIPRETWYRHLVHHRGRRAQLLHAYERLGLVGVQHLAREWGLEWGRDIVPANQPGAADLDENSAA